MKKKILSIIALMTAFTFVLAGCGSSSSSSDSDSSAGEEESETVSVSDGDFKVAFSLGESYTERWEGEITMFEEYFEEIGVDFQYQVANGENNTQVSQCENFITQGIDVLIITPFDAYAASSIVEACKEEGITVVVYDQPIDSAEVDYLVTFDAVETGELIAHCAFDNAPEGNYIILNGDASNINAQNIYTGFMNVIGDAVESGDINIVLEQWVDSWDASLALEYTENALTANENDIVGICVANDNMAGGAVEALEAQGLAGVVYLGGQDSDLAACQRIVEGTQYGTVYKNLQALNEATCQLVYAILSGEEDPTASVDSDLATIGEFEVSDGSMIPYIQCEQILVTAENIKEVIVDSGFHTLEEVYANIDESEWPE